MGCLVLLLSLGVPHATGATKITLSNGETIEPEEIVIRGDHLIAVMPSQDGAPSEFHVLKREQLSPASAAEFFDPKTVVEPPPKEQILATATLHFATTPKIDPDLLAKAKTYDDVFEEISKWTRKMRHQQMAPYDLNKDGNVDFDLLDAYRAAVQRRKSMERALLVTWLHQQYDTDRNGSITHREVAFMTEEARQYYTLKDEDNGLANLKRYLFRIRYFDWNGDLIVSDVESEIAHRFELAFLKGDPDQTILRNHQ